MRRLIAIVSLIAALFAPSVQAQGLYLVRVTQPFEQVMEQVKTTVREYGYSIAKTQRIDRGMTSAGYKTDYYRIVFFAKLDEMRELTAKYPEVIPYLPLKITVFAENDDTLLMVMSPEQLGHYYQQPELKTHFSRWESDLLAILAELREMDSP